MSYGNDQGKTRESLAFIVDEKTFRIIVTVEFLRQIFEVERDEMRCEIAGGNGELRRKIGQPPQQRVLVTACQRREIDLCQPRRRFVKGDAGLLQHRAHARMRVLNVVNRIIFRLRTREIDIENELGIGLARYEEEADRIAADFVDQVANRHIASGALADLDLFAAAHHRDHLVQNIIGIAGRNAHSEGLQAGAYTRDRAVMVGALHVDRSHEPAFPLGDVVSDIGDEIRVPAIGFAHHAILVVAVVSRAQPQCAVLFVHCAGCGKT